MTSVRSLRPNFLTAAIIFAGVAILGADRLVYLPPLRAVATQLYSWALLLAAFALILGVVNVAWIHFRQVLIGSDGWQHSLALVLILLFVLIAGLINEDGVRSPLVEWLFDSIIAPGQATLFALLAFFMAAAAYRFLRVGATGGAWMLAGALLVIVAQMPLTNALLPAPLTNLAAWLLQVPGMAALRGALLGSGFALLIVAVRFLLTNR